MLAFVLALIAGAVVPFCQETIRQFLPKVGKGDIALEDTEIQILTLLALLIAVALLVALSGSHAHALPLLFGGGIGFFGKRIWVYVKTNTE